MVTSLASLFRISLSKGRNIIPIRSELEHAQNYLSIQKLRYKNHPARQFRKIAQLLEFPGKHFDLLCRKRLCKSRRENGFPAHEQRSFSKQFRRGFHCMVPRNADLNERLGFPENFAGKIDGDGRHPLSGRDQGQDR